MTSPDNNNTTTSSEMLYSVTLQPTTHPAEDDFDVKKRLVTAFTAVIVYLAIVGIATLSCWLYKRYRDRRKRSGGLSIAEYCNRSYNSASASNVHDAIFSVHFSAATDDVHLPTPLNADDLQRLDADFNAAMPTEDDHICPYATFAEIEQLQATRDGGRSATDAPTAARDLRGLRTADNGVDAAAEIRRTRPRKAGTATGRDHAHHRLEPERIAANNDLNALYAQPHKLIRKDSISFTTDDQKFQSQELFSNV